MPMVHVIVSSDLSASVIQESSTMEIVSTRSCSSPSKSSDFGIDEWVLCYEPDPSKVKVIYNAKILDEDGKEFLVHFRGWNSSWDRWVTKEHLLKDTPSNRKLQDSLSENAFKKDSSRKKSPSRKRPLKNSSGPSSGVTNGSSTAPSESRRNRRRPPSESLKITEPCRTFLKMDNARVLKQGLNPLFPSSVPIVKVLENYVTAFAERIIALGEKAIGKGSLLPASQRESLLASELESIQGSLEVCKEIMDGLRIMLDNYIKSILLYEEEDVSFKKRLPESSTTRRRPSSSVPSVSSGRSTPTTASSSLPSCSSSSSSSHSLSFPPNRTFKCVMDSLADWRLLPEVFYEEGSPLLPSMTHGPIYILRLLTKLPQILSCMDLPLERVKVIQKQMIYLMEYLGAHPEYFSENMYSSPSGKVALPSTA